MCVLVCLSFFLTFSPPVFVLMSLPLAIQNKKYSNSDFITKICVTLCLVFPLDRSYCIFKKHALMGQKTCSHVNTWIVLPEYACMHVFSAKVFTWTKLAFFLTLLRLLSTDRIHSECLDVWEHIYLHPYGSRITNSISKCIHFSEREKNKI